MNFIAENYLWIIISIIIILMAIVGYIADKTEFIKKSDKKIEPKKNLKEKKQKEEPVVIEDKGIDELLHEAVGSSENMENDNKTVDTTTAPLNDDIMSPLVSEPVNDDIMSPLVSEPANEDNSTIDESLFAPLDSNVSDTESSAELNPIEVTSLENVDTNEEPAVVNEEEDIWKF